MSTYESSHNGLSPRCAAALREIDRLLETGQPVDRSAFLATYPDVAGELQGHFDVADLLDELRRTGTASNRGPSGERPIESFGDYEVQEELGRGGMAVVYKARQQSLDRLVALKFPLGGALAGAAAAERFRQEALALASLRHPHIVGIHEVGLHDGRTYLSMEYVEGVDLARRLREEPPSIRQAVEIARSIAAAIQYAHEHGIVHRDLKPANVLIDHSGAVRVADFGLGKILAADPSLTQTGQILGTLRYMPPEHADGTDDDRPEAGDIYAIGAILYELLSGRPAFWANSTGALIRQIFEQDPVPLRQLDPNIPRDLDTICLKCLNKNPAERYATARQLAEDLQRFLDDRPIAARAITGVERVWRWCRRRPVIALLSGLTAVSTAATILIAVWLWRAAIHSREAAIASRQLAEKHAVAESRLARRNELAVAVEQMERIRLAAHKAGWSRHCGELIAHAAGVERTEQLKDQYVACLAGVDGELAHVWDFRSSSVAISDDGRQLLLGGGISGNTRSWHADTKAFVESPQPGFGPVGFNAHGDGVQWLAESPSSFVLWNLTRQTEICRVQTRVTNDRDTTIDTQATARLLDQVTLCMSRDATMLAASVPAVNSAVASATFVWTADGQLLRRIEGQATALCFSPDHALLAAGREDGRIDLIGLADERPTVTLQESVNRVHGLDFIVDPRRDSSDPNWLLAAADAGGVVTVWDVGRRRPRSRCLGSEWNVFAVRFSPDGMTLATAGRDGARLWDYMTGRMLLHVRMMGDHATELAFTRDGQQLAVSSRGSPFAQTDPYATTVWSLDWGRGVDLLNGLSGQVAQTHVSFDGRHVAALGQNWDVGVYELDPPRLKYILQAPVGEYADNAALVISRDNRLLAASTGSEVRVWELSSGALVEQYRLPPGLVDQLAFTPDGELLSCRWECQDGLTPPFVAGQIESRDRVLRLRNLSSVDPLAPLAEIRHFEGRVIKGAAHPDGRFFIAEGQLRFGDHNDEEIVAFDGSTGTIVWRSIAKEPEVWPVLDSNGSTLTYRHSNGHAMLVGVPSGPSSQFLTSTVVALSPGAQEWLSLDEATNGDARGLAWHRRGAARRLALLGSDFKPHHSTPRFSRDGRIAIFGTSQGAVVVCDLPEIERRLAEFEHSHEPGSPSP